MPTASFLLDVFPDLPNKLPEFLLSNIKKNWNAARHEAIISGCLLGEYLLYNRPKWTKKKLILVGFSLGAQIIINALETAGASNRVIADEVYLYGGAAPICAHWPSIASGVRKVIHNHFSCNDKILREVYPLAVESYNRNAIGCYPIHSTSRKIRDWDVTEYIFSHSDYEESIREFERFD